MKQKTVFLLCGIPASGKSTWARAHMTPTTEWISRDKVRFSIVREDEEYFSHEDEVFDTFIAYINQTLENPEVDTIFIDATHISKGARRKVLSRIRKQNIAELNCVWFDVSLDTCLARNHLRAGRERVPETAIENMYKSKTYPSKIEEGFNTIFIVDENGIAKVVE
jgi:predicted kinase